VLEKLVLELLRCERNLPLALWVAVSIPTTSIRSDRSKRKQELQETARKIDKKI
jgi:hypothetical protein